MLFKEVEELERIERLSGLSLSEEEKKILYPDMRRIIEYMERITNLPTEEGAAVSEPAGDMPLREDIAEEATLAPEILKQAPEAGDGMFSVPRTVE